MGGELFAESCDFCEQLIAKPGAEHRFMGGGLVFFSDRFLPLGGEDKVKLVVEVAGKQRFPLARIEPDAARDRAVDSEIEPVADLVARHDRAGFRADFHGVLEVAGGFAVHGRMMIRGGGKMSLPFPIVFGGNPVAVRFRTDIGLEAFFQGDWL